MELTDSRPALGLFSSDGTPLGLTSSLAELLALPSPNVQALGRALSAEEVRAHLSDSAGWDWARAGRQLRLSACRIGEHVVVCAVRADDQAARALAEGRARTFGVLSESVVHDVRGALNSLAIHLALLKSRLREGDSGPSPELDRHLSAIHEQVRQADSVLRRLLRLASASGERPALVDFSELAELAVKACTLEARRRGIRLERQLEPAPVRADPARLQHALVQLILGGIAQVAEGGRLQLVLVALEDEARLSVHGEPRLPALAEGEGLEPSFSLAEALVQPDGGAVSARRTELGGALLMRLPLANPSSAAGEA